jgi:hypothetical protein
VTVPAVPGDVCLPSALTADGIDAFHLTGLIAGGAVTAHWDGTLLTVSPPLYQRAALAVAIDSLFSSRPDGVPSRRDGRGPARWRFALAGPATGVIVTLASSCDVVDVVEFRQWGRRRAIVAVAGGSAATMDLSGGDPAGSYAFVGCRPRPTGRG